MATAYQYDASGYFAGNVEDYGGPLPNNATHAAPLMREGHIPRWNGSEWEHVENHKGREGFVNGKAHTIAEYGPYPEGWSETAPLPSLSDIHSATVQAINAAFEAAITPLTAAEPPSATATYNQQRAEAEAYSADTKAPTPMLDALAAARGIKKADLARRVLEKSALHAQASGLLLGQQQALMDAVQAIMSSRISETKKIAKLEQLDIIIGLPKRATKRKGKTA